MPTFLIIGAVKSGTTSLARYLGDHPDVFVFPSKEIGFFDEQYEVGIEHYRSYFQGWSGESAIGEATPSYMFHPLAIGRIAEVLPNVRLIAILRNPIERAYADYWRDRSRGRELRSFDKVIATELCHARARAAEPPAPRPRPGDAPALDYLERGLYMNQLARVVEAFPRESLLVQLYDDLLADPERLFQAAAVHIGVDSSQIQASVGKPFGTYVSFRSLRLREYALRIGGKRGKILGRINVKKSAEYPPMDPAVKAALLNYFAEPNDRLATWLDRDLSHWAD